MPVDWMEFLEKGGPFLLTSAALAWACWQMWKRLQEVIDARINDQKEFTQQMREVSDASTSAINNLTRVVEDRLRG